MLQPKYFKVNEMINLQNNVAVAPTEYVNFRIGLRTNRPIKKCSIVNNENKVIECTQNDQKCKPVINIENKETCQFDLKNLDESGNKILIFP